MNALVIVLRNAEATHHCSFLLWESAWCVEVWVAVTQQVLRERVACYCRCRSHIHNTTRYSSEKTWLLPFLCSSLYYSLYSHPFYVLQIALKSSGFFSPFTEQHLQYWILHETLFAWMRGAISLHSMFGKYVLQCIAGNTSINTRHCRCY